MISEYLSYRRAKKKLLRLQAIDGHDVMRDFILDCRISEGQQLNMLLGLEVTPDDVERSQVRTKRVAHLTPIVSFLASSLVTSVMEYYETVSPFKEELNDEERAAITTWISKISASCALGVLSTLDHLELLRVER